jgi:hypothetical protein
MIDIQWPSFSDHPPSPWLDNESYALWILNEWLPLCAERGEMTEEKLLADFHEQRRPRDVMAGLRGGVRIEALIPA